MKKHSAIFLLVFCTFFMTACGGRGTSFQAVILEVSAKEEWCLVEPVEGSRELDSADRIEISLFNDLPAAVAYDIAHEAKAGDIVEITYEGGILETYPAQLEDVCNIEIIEKAEE